MSVASPTAMLPLLLAPLGSAGLAYLFCYGGFEGPVDWAMDTTTHTSRDRRQIALTFDDGPDPERTPALLDTLRALDVKATFFVVGSRVEQYPELCARIARDGHELGNHTYSHRYLPLARRKHVEAELVAADAAIERATGIVPAIARPPYGGRSPSNVRVFDKVGKRVVLWDVNSNDWKGAPAEQVAGRILERARPGSIVLMHDGGRAPEATLGAVRLVVPALRALGFDLVTVSRALAA